MSEKPEEEVEDKPIEVIITNHEKKEITQYDTQDDIEYQDISNTIEEFEKDVDEQNGTQS